MSRELEQEDGNDEPGGDDELSLGSQDAVINQAAAWKHSTDIHPADDCEHDDSDDEPSLGTIEATSNYEYNYYGEPIYLTVSGFNQAAGQGSTSDCEGDEHDGGEPDVDDEPSLCGIHADCRGSCDDGEADLGSPDGITDQRRTMLASGVAWSVEGGEAD